jgi:hypothetical protein
MKLVIWIITLTILATAFAVKTEEPSTFLGLVSDTNLKPVAKANVSIEGGGAYTTSDRGEFSFPPSDRIDEEKEAIFHVDTWIVVKPCEGQNGREFLPAKSRTIEISVIKSGDSDLKDFVKTNKKTKCTIEEAVTNFDVGLNPPPKANAYNKLPTPSLVPTTSNPDLIYPGKLFSSNTILFRAMGAQINSKFRDQDQFLEDKAEEYDISKVELESELAQWLAAPHSGYDLGIAQLYQGQYIAATKTLSDAISPEDQYAYRFVALARAELERGNVAGATQDLNRVLQIHRQDSLVKKNLSIIAGLPKAPESLRATINQ